MRREDGKGGGTGREERGETAWYENKWKMLFFLKKSIKNIVNIFAHLV